MKKVIVFFILVAVLAINVDARLPPPEARRQPALSSSSSNPTDSSPKSSSESDSAELPSTSPDTSDQDSIGSPHEELEDALRALTMFGRQFDLMRRWNLQNFPGLSDDSRLPSFPTPNHEMPFPAFPAISSFPLFRPSILRRPQMPSLDLPSLIEPSFLSFKGFDPKANYTLVRSSNYTAPNGKTYCQEVYEKKKENEFGTFTSTITTIQLCDEKTKKDNEESATDLSTAEDSKKKADRGHANPGVEREDQPTETPVSTGSNNREPNEIKPEVTKEPTATVQPTEQPTDKVDVATNTTTAASEDSKPKEKSVENEISDKPSRSEPTITVNDGK